MVVNNGGKMTGCVREVLTENDGIQIHLNLIILIGMIGLLIDKLYF